jgi:arabinofuranosyltransferase
MRALLRLAYPVVFTLVACWLIFSVQGHPKWGVDDAQIFFSYSSNLAAGRGFVYASNPEHVEGATSLLWTLVCAIPFGLGFDEPGVLAISILLLCLTQFVIIDIIRRAAATRKIRSWPFELAYLLAVFSSPMYLTWMTVSLMDTCLWGFLVVLMMFVALSPPRSKSGMALACMPFFLAPLSRPEAGLVAPAIIGLAWLSDGGRREDRRRLILGPGLAFLASTVGVTAFRLVYFGYPLPNTYYAKVSPSLSYNLTKGGEYLLGFALTSGPVILATALFLLWCAVDLAPRLFHSLHAPVPHASRIGVATWRIAALCAMVLLFVPVLSGGDHFVGYRFYQPASPVMILAAVLFLIARLPSLVIHGLAPERPLRPGITTVVLLLGSVYWAYSGAVKPSWLDVQISVQKPLQDQFIAAEDGINKGMHLRALFAEASDYPAVGVIAAGGFARTYPGRIVDLMGLNTPSIAHHRGPRRGFHGHTAFEKDAFFSLSRIDLLDVAPPIPPKTKSFATVALKGLLDDPRFFSKWRYGRLCLSREEESGYQAFYSGGLIDSLVRTGRYRFDETMRWSGKWVLVGRVDSADSRRARRPDVRVLVRE